MDREIDPRPVYEYDQVLTVNDLTSIYHGYVFQHKNLPWYNVPEKFKLRVAAGVCYTLIHWLSHGKPAELKCKGGNVHGV